MLRTWSSRAGLLCLALVGLACGGCSDGGSGDASSSSSTTIDPTGGVTALDCKSYCATITGNCTAANAQYATIQQCQSTCAGLELGAETDRDGNTLGCRVYHADAAASDPDTHCSHAGPGGAGQCGADCDGFCGLAAYACPGTFADDAACRSACADYDASEPYDAGDKVGDSLACRLYHLTVATEDPDAHCPHILPDSGPCGGA